MSENTRINLVNSWELEKISFICVDNEDMNFDSYVSKKDYENIEEDNKNEFIYFYQTHVLPQPFFGNIKNPKIVVLAKNPAYDIFNEFDEFDKLKKKYGLQSNNDENLINFIINNGNKLLFDNEFSDSCTQKWWKTIFKDLLPDDGFETLLNKIGIFNLCGYHSRSYYEFPKRFLKDKDKDYFETQIALKEHLEAIKKECKKPIFIIIWGEQEWRNFLPEDFFEGTNLLVVNKKKDGSYSTTRTIVNSEDFNKTIDKDFKAAFKKYFSAESETDEYNQINEIKKYIKEIKMKKYKIKG